MQPAMANVGVLLLQLGTPDAPTAQALRPYLRQFLGDPRVIEVPRWKWWFVLNLFILPFRPAASAAKYRRIWDAQTGQPVGVELVRAQRLHPGHPRQRRPHPAARAGEGEDRPDVDRVDLPPGARIERFRLHGQFAAWVEGLHVFFYKPSADYTFHIGRSRLAANALVLQRGDVMIRLEGKLDKATALAIARSLRTL